MTYTGTNAGMAPDTYSDCHQECVHNACRAAVVSKGEKRHTQQLYPEAAKAFANKALGRHQAARS